MTSRYNTVEHRLPPSNKPLALVTPVASESDVHRGGTGA